MIRYFEYLYLAVALGLVAFLAMDFQEMTTGNIIVLMVGILLSSFMYSFRRKQRQVLEAEDRKEMEALEAEIADEEEEDMTEDKDNGA